MADTGLKKNLITPRMLMAVIWLAWLVLMHFVHNKLAAGLLTIVSAIAVAILARRPDEMANSFGYRRDFSRRRLSGDFFRAGIILLVAITWATAFGAANRFRLLPNRVWLAHLAVDPVFIILALFFVFLGRGILRVIFGIVESRR